MTNPIFANSNSNSNYQTVKFSSETHSIMGLYNSAHASGDPLRNSRNISRAGSGLVSARAASGAGKSEKDGPDLINKIKSGMQGHQNSSN
jgi:hypothetical protein